MSKAETALADLISWSNKSEIDFYYYVKEFFRHVLGYPKENVVLTEKGAAGGIPDLSIASKDAPAKDKVFWVVGEVKREPSLFRSKKTRRKHWDSQLRKYITSDTIYSLLLDPSTLAVLKPNGEEVTVVELDRVNVQDLLSPSAESSIQFLSYDNSVSDRTLAEFKEGHAPSRFIDVGEDDGREEFYRTLHVCSRELVNYSLGRIKSLYESYTAYREELAKVESKATGDATSEQAINDIKRKYSQPRVFVDQYLDEFRRQIGKALPKRREDELDYLLEVYATEGSSLLLARILFVRFSEDHGMTTRKISNGGIKRYRDFFDNVKDDYRHLLVTAFKDLERIYARLFEPSVFDWAHEGNGELSRLLLRIFYRLNAFDFTKITGDLLGNLYERFLPLDKRKKLGEYYTPLPVAEYVLERIGFFDHPGPILDPACGSGTFLFAAAEGLVRRMASRGVSPTVAVEQALGLVRGVDLNMFASFIAQLQLIWHLFPYVKTSGAKEISLPEIQVFGGLSALVWAQHTLSDSLLREYADKSQRTRDGSYRYVVGNPPYIRNERLKDRGPWRAFFEDVDHRNSDVSFFFVQRAIVGGRRHNAKGPDTTKPKWLTEGGRMCFVLPHGICDSDAARPLREAFFERRVLEVTDLEEIAQDVFPSPQASSRATTAPVLLFLENSAPSSDSAIEIVQVPRNALSATRLDKSGLSTSQVFQSEALDSRLNPDRQLLTKLRDLDVPILKKIRRHRILQDFMLQSTPTYGVKVGGGNVLSTESRPGLLPLRKGANVCTYHLNDFVSRWVNLRKVESRSIWTDLDQVPPNAFATSGIAFTLQCCQFNPQETCLNDSTRVFIPNEDGRDIPWDVIVNSAPVRFTHLLTLRAGLVGVGTPVDEDRLPGRTAAWCTIYPRSVALLPVPNDLGGDLKGLAKMASELRELAAKIQKRWTVINEGLISGARTKAALHEVDFSHWNGWPKKERTLTLKRTKSSSRLMVGVGKQSTFSYLEGPYDVLNVMKHLFDQEGTGALDVQEVLIPDEAAKWSTLIDDARDPESPNIRRFRRLQEACDSVISGAFGLNEREAEAILKRLATPPFDVLEPRWPWSSVEFREIQEYDRDRFA